MLIKRFLTITAIFASLAAFHPALAKEEDGHGHMHEHAPAAKPTSMQDAWAEIQNGMKALDEMVNAGKLDGIHDQIEKVEASTTTLKASANVDAEKKARLDGAIKQFSAKLGKAHAASDKNDKDATAAQLKKARAAMKLIETAIK